MEQFLIGLVSGLSEIEGDIEYVLVTNPRAPDWIEQYAGDNMDVQPRPWKSRVERFRALLGPVEPAIRRFVKPVIESISESDFEIPNSDGFFADIGADVVHFPTQHYARTNVPCIFNPHDLQHEHYPEYYSAEELHRRRTLYRTACTEATAVDVPSHFVRDDLEEQYDIAREKVYAIDRGPPVVAYDEPAAADIEKCQSKHSLANTFVLYPAKSWPHKNHLKLVEALAVLREEHDGEATLVCTGRRTAHWDEVGQRIDELGIGDLVKHLGFVSPTELRCLYRLAHVVAIPSLFEGGGFPLLEAWQERTPVACSNVTALAEKAGDAAALFDPVDPDDMASSLKQVCGDSSFRESLVSRGTERVTTHTWDGTARTYEALYRSVGGEELNATDSRLLRGAQTFRTDT